MNGTNGTNVTDAEIQKVLSIIGKTKEAIMAGWQKAVKLTGKTDLLAVVEPDQDDVSILILPREAGLTLLDEKGCDTKHPSLERLTEAARGLTPESTALWVVVLFDGKTHLTKMVNQPMSQGGSA